MAAMRELAMGGTKSSFWAVLEEGTFSKETLTQSSRTRNWKRVEYPDTELVFRQRERDSRRREKEGESKAERT